MGEPIHRTAQVAAEAVRFAVLEGTFDTLELVERLPGSVPVSEIERTLRQLECAGWLERSDRDSPVWHAGERARDLSGDVRGTPEGLPGQ
jgi:hypothetical protein